MYDYSRETDLLDTLSTVDEPLSAVVERFGSVERAKAIVAALCQSGLATLRTRDGGEVQSSALSQFLSDERNWVHSSDAPVLCGTPAIESMMSGSDWRQRLQRALGSSIRHHSKT